MSCGPYGYLKYRPSTLRLLEVQTADPSRLEVQTTDPTVRLEVQTADPAVKICVTAIVLGKICHPISQQPVRASIRYYPHLDGLKLADYHNDDVALEIELLLRDDFYYQFVSDVLIRGDQI